MTRSRHRRSGGSGEGSTEPASLPSWAQRHLDESGYAPAVTTSHRRTAGTRPESPLRGWGLAIMSVAAAVTAVPLAINAVAHDRSDDPLPTVDTYTAGSPQTLDGQGGPATRRGASDVAGDQATAGILTAPGAGPGAPPVAAPAPVVPAPLPAAVVRPTTPPVPTITPRAATPTTTAATKPTTTTSGADDGEGRSTTKPTGPTKKPTSESKPAPSDGNDGGSRKPDGPVTGLVKGVGNTLGGVTGALGL